MSNDKANKSIHCTVLDCRYHCDEKDFCSLSKINVGTNEADPTDVQCTNCESFKRK
ncbi:MAG: DUF1540 domain-containing protein [Eubacteriales bacterium]